LTRVKSAVWLPAQHECVKLHAKSPRRVAMVSNRAGTPDVAEQWFRAYRAGFDTLLAVGSAAVAGAERTHMAQIEADVETQTMTRETALAAAGARDLSALVALQSRLARSYLECSMHYWSSVASLVQQTQAEIAQILFARLGEWGRAAQGAPGAPAAMLRAVGSFVPDEGARRGKAA
jgi:hypothetical protein